MTKKKLPEIAPCMCPKKCEAITARWSSELWYVVSRCGFAGPQRMSERAAILAWNRRGDAEAERRGARAVVAWLRSYGQTAATFLARELEDDIEHGEVTGKRGRR